MKFQTLAALALGAMALPSSALALSVTLAWDASRSTGSDWSRDVMAGLNLSLLAQDGIEVSGVVSYDGPEDFEAALADVSADVVLTDYADASAMAAGPLFFNLGTQPAENCTTNMVHLAGDVALGRLAAIYMNGINAQRTFAFVKESDEGKRHLDDFRRAFTGGLGGAAFAREDQVDFENEMAILRVTKADGAYLDLEGEALYRYLDAFAMGEVLEQTKAVTTSHIDYDRVPEETRAALDAMTLVSAWNADTVDAADFKEAFNAETGADPSFAGLLGYEAGTILLDAMDGEGDSLFTNIVGLSVLSPRGPLSFDAQGFAIVPVGAYSFTDEALSLKGRIAVAAEHNCSAS
ncbi:MAG: hypothetical protein ACPG42_03185 [Alphaproteobacteria bacterium]